MKTLIIAEAGVNHNGDIEIAKQLIMVAKAAGCDYVKFQKRNPDVCVPEDQKSKMRQTPWGEITYLEYKWKTEFGEKEYDEIDRFCKIGTIIGFDDYNVRQVQAAATQWLSRNPKWKVLYLAFGQHGMTNLFIEKII